MCPFVRYIFLRTHWTEFDETLLALSPLPDDVKNAKKNLISRNFFFDFSIFSEFIFEIIILAFEVDFGEFDVITKKISKCSEGVSEAN